MMASGLGHQAEKDLHNAEPSAARPTDPLAEMGRAGLEFAEQFEMKRVLAAFEDELMRIDVSRNGGT